MLGCLFLTIFWAACLGQQFNNLDKPILRMAPENTEKVELAYETETSAPVLEPPWVTVLRDNIKMAVQYKGFEKARENIKNMIQEANQEINGEENRIQREIARMRSYVDTGLMEEPEAIADRMQPQWVKDLKKYIKGLIGRYGKSHLDDYVRPVVSAIEDTNGIAIKDIDGEVSIKWKYKGGQRPQMRSFPFGDLGMPAMSQFQNN